MIANDSRDLNLPNELNKPPFHPFPSRPGSRISAMRSVSRSTVRQDLRTPIPLGKLKEFRSPK